MRGSADGVLLYAEDGRREIALPQGPRFAFWTIPPWQFAAADSRCMTAAGERSKSRQLKFSAQLRRHGDRMPSFAPANT